MHWCVVDSMVCIGVCVSIPLVHIAGNRLDQISEDPAGYR